MAVDFPEPIDLIRLAVWINQDAPGSPVSERDDKTSYTRRTAKSFYSVSIGYNWRTDEFCVLIRVHDAVREVWWDAKLTGTAEFP